MPTSPASVAPVPTPDIERDPEPAVVRLAAAEDVPALPPAEPAPQVPAALVAHARKVADDYQTRTGSRIDTDTLRARLGVPAAMADAIAAQLT